MTPPDLQDLRVFEGWQLNPFVAEEFERFHHHPSEPRQTTSLARQTITHPGGERMRQRAETHGPGGVHRAGGRGRVRFWGTVQCRRSLTENLKPPSAVCAKLRDALFLKKPATYASLTDGAAAALDLAPEPSTRSARRGFERTGKRCYGSP